MKKLLVMLVAVGFIAGTANAATLWMQFEGGGNEVTLAPSQNVNVEVWVDLIPGEGLSGMSAPWWPAGTADAPSYPGGVEGLVEMSAVGVPSGWIDASQLDVIGLPGASIIVGASDPGTQSLVGPGSFMVGLMTIHQNDILSANSPNFPDFYPVMFGGDPNGTPQLSKANGQDYPWSPVYASHPYSGYYTWGQGASAISGKAPGGAYSIDANPLMVHCVIPEPASLSLLALGGLALIRRR